MKTFALLLAAALCAVGAPEDRLVRVPGGGAVPDAEVDARGVIHLAYVTGENLLYTCSTDGGHFIATPDRAHSPTMFCGPDIALGKDGAFVILY